MFCSNCGTQNGDGSAFCVNCGKPLNNNAPAAPTGQPAYDAPGHAAAMNQMPVTAVQTAVAPVKKPNYTLIGIISIAAVAVIIVVIVLLALGGGGRSIIGTWASDPDTDYEITVTFEKNGKVTVESAGYEETAKYKIKGDTMTIITEDGYEETAQFKITKVKGKTVLILTPEDEASMTLYKQ